jgi:hypothetical protein
MVDNWSVSDFPMMAVGGAQAFVSEAAKLFIIHFSKPFSKSVKIEVADVNAFQSG